MGKTKSPSIYDTASQTVFARMGNYYKQANTPEDKIQEVNAQLSRQIQRARKRTGDDTPLGILIEADKKAKFGLRLSVMPDKEAALQFVQKINAGHIGHGETKPLPRIPGTDSGPSFRP